jgi:hypothetical protein
MTDRLERREDDLNLVLADTCAPVFDRRGVRLGLVVALLAEQQTGQFKFALVAMNEASAVGDRYPMCGALNVGVASERARPFSSIPAAGACGLRHAA